MHKVLLFFTLSLCAYAALAQSYSRKENNIWLNSGKGIDFNSGAPAPKLSGWQSFSTYRASASICDANGNLLFYTDGNIVWNRNNDVMPYGWDINNNGNMAPNTYYIDPLINQSSYSFDGVVIMHVPGSYHKYYVFAVPYLLTQGPNGLYGDQWQGQLFCTVVDMELNNGLGAVDTGFRGVIVANEMAGNLQAVTGEDCNYWLVGFGSDGTYKAFNITADSIHTTPVVSALAPPLSPYVQDFNMSPNRQKVAMSASEEILLSDFDAATGTFSNEIPIGGQSSRFAAFSPNSSLLYIGGLIGLRQYNLNDLSIPFNLIMINNYTAYEQDNPLRLGPDGKMYFSYYTDPAVTPGPLDNGVSAACVQHPDVWGTGCDAALMPDQDLPLMNSTWGAYEFPQEIPVLIYDTVSEVKKAPICFHKPAVLSPGVDGTDYHWMANTVGTTFIRKGNDSTDTLLATDPGTYAVQYFTTNPCTFHRDTFVVEDINYSLYLGPDQVSCDGSPVSLDAGIVAGAAYLWQDSSSNQGLEADTSGLYWVEVSKGGCSARDSIRVTIMVQQNIGKDTLMCIEDAVDIPLHAQVPAGASALWSTGETTSSIVAQDSGLYWVQVSYANCSVSDSVYIHEEYCDCTVLFSSAFSPNGDGVNDRFGPVADGACPVTDYRMEIYNRWGQRVFVSFNADETWDGTINGKPADAGTYMYRVQARSGLRYTVVQQKGDLTLIR